MGSKVKLTEIFSNAFYDIIVCERVARKMNGRDIKIGGLPSTFI